MIIIGVLSALIIQVLMNTYTSNQWCIFLRFSASAVQCSIGSTTGYTITEKAPTTTRHYSRPYRIYFPKSSKVFKVDMMCKAFYLLSITAESKRGLGTVQLNKVKLYPNIFSVVLVLLFTAVTCACVPLPCNIKMWQQSPTLFPKQIVLVRIFFH